MTTETIIANTKQMIDDLKTVCANFGLGNASSEYKIITEIFLYKFLNDKFLYEVQQAEESLKDSDNVEQALNDMSEDDYEMLMMLLPPATAKLKKEHSRNLYNSAMFLFLISYYLYRRYFPASFSRFCIHNATHASLGILQSPLGDNATVPTFGPSGRQDLLNCCEKNLQQNVRSHL